jgi:hypothetical protein
MGVVAALPQGRATMGALDERLVTPIVQGIGFVSLGP